MNKFILIGIILLNLLNPFTHAQTETQTRPKIGLVLSGGSAKGIAHVGVLKVLEELGIKPDFIGGTSMGSIVGALYATGYSIDSIEQIGLTTDWNYILGDEISRLNLALEEKEDADRFFLSIPIKETGLEIPSGVKNGQNIENRFNTLFSPVFEIRNFNELPVPFVCIATDIETGKEVVMREGYLPQAVRASMSIPTIFNPIEINNQLLVDGGLVNNFPVNRVKEMGADIIIGVDVGFHYYKKNELSSILKILEQALFFYGEENNSKNKALCDILITPEFGIYNSYSFTAADSLIAIGERAARKMLPQLQALADSLNSFGTTNNKERVLNKIDTLLLTDIRIRGLSKVSGTLVTGKLQLNVLDKVTPADIESAIERLYSSLYFEKIDYELVKKDDGVALLINVIEAKGGQFRLGVHYDTNYRSAILLNATIRNLVLDGSKISASVALGENPFFSASIFKNNGWKPGLGIRFNSSKLDAFIYENGKKISSLAYSENKLQVYTQSIFSNSYSVGAGLEYEHVNLRPKIDPTLGIQPSDDEFINYFGFVKMDSYDHGYYPKKGIKFDSQLKFITREYQDAFLFFVGRFSQAISLSKKITLINHLYAGTVDGDSIPYQYNFYTGGTNPTTRNGLLPFVGLDYMEIVNENALIWGADLQVELFKDIYAIGKINIGNLQKNFSDLFTTDDLIGGYGLTIGYDSFIGPIEISAQKSVKQAGFLGFINIGFWF